MLLVTARRRFIPILAVWARARALSGFEVGLSFRSSSQVTLIHVGLGQAYLRTSTLHQHKTA